jgi:hypothetical protein
LHYKMRTHTKCRGVGGWEGGGGRGRWWWGEGARGEVGGGGFKEGRETGEAKERVTGNNGVQRAHGNYLTVTTHTQMCTHTHIPTCTYAYAHVSARFRISFLIISLTHSLISHHSAPARSHTHTHTHTHTQFRMHKHTHARTPSRRSIPLSTLAASHTHPPTYPRTAMGSGVQEGLR